MPEIDVSHLQSLLDHESIRQLMYGYARACDRRDAVALASCFTDDVEVLVPSAPILRGPDAAWTITRTLEERFALTQHLVHNVSYRIEGDRAEGETYCTALHVLPATDDGRQLRLDYGIRYQDRLRRLGGAWKIHRRELIIDWTDRRAMSS